jgi:putative ATP-binding cassette transporter
MSLIRLLWNETPKLFMSSIAFGIAGAISRLGLLVLISASLSNFDTPAVSVWGFIMLVCVALIAQYGGVWANGAISTNISVKLRKDITNLVLHTPLRGLERIGTNRITSALGEDIGRILNGLPWGVIFIRSTVFILLSFVYLAFESMDLLLLVIAVMIPGIAALFLMQRAFLFALIQIRDSRDLGWLHHRMLIDGIKQLKLDGWKREQFETAYENVENSFFGVSARATRYYNWSVTLFLSLYFILLGIFLYGGLFQYNDKSVMVSFLILTVVVIPPLLEMSAGSRAFGEASVGVERIQRLKGDLAEFSAGQSGSSGFTIKPATEMHRDTKVSKLELQNVSCVYQGKEGASFTLGPVDLVVNSGEVLFVVGGNGSGKTTLAKILSGLYVPDEGQILANGSIIAQESLELYRREVSAVFSDICLFEGLSLIPPHALMEKLQYFISKLRLEHLVGEDGQLVPRTASYSAGERKRVALLFSCLEDRSIYIFDEFAADQDPAAKDLFYNWVLPELRALGKILIVVTHDNRYFDTADKLLRLERGCAPTFTEGKVFDLQAV